MIGCISTYFHLLLFLELGEFFSKFSMRLLFHCGVWLFWNQPLRLPYLKDKFPILDGTQLSIRL